MHSEDDLIARAHNHHQQQQTTQQITTITKVVREVKQLGPDAGQPFDYVAMPLDMGTDGQPIDYVSMPMGMYTTRTQYLNFNHMDQPEQMVGGAGGGPPVQQSAHLPPGAKVMGGGGPGMPGAMGGGGGGQGHYQDYEHYAQYTDAGYDLGQAAHHPGHAQSYLGEYQMNDRSNTPHTSSENSESSIPMPMGVAQMGGGNPSAAALMAGPGGYLQGQYDEMGEYVIAPGQGGPVDRLYPDNPSAMVYGYVSTPPYGTISSHMDPNGGVEPTYATKQQLAYEAATAQQRAGGGVGGGGVVGNVAPDGSCYYDGEDDLHQQLSNLQIHNHVFLQHIITSPGGNNRPGVSGAGGPSNGAGGGGGGMPDGSGGGMDLDEQRQMKWRDPNLTEVIGFLSHPNNAIKANAAAYLQHLCYMDDPNKQRTRTLGGIPPLVKLLGHENTDVFRNACGALRNLSYGRQNDENKRAINAAGGIQALIHLLRRTAESDIKELVTGIIWNMSSCEDLKRFIIDDAVLVIVSYIIIPHSGWDPTNPGETCWSTVFRNASGILRNVSSAGEYARKKLRECEGLVDSLLYVIRIAIEKSNIGNKIVENCVCILRNLSYRCQEVEDPNYDKNPIPHHGSDGGMSGGSGSHGGGSIVVSAAAASSKGENLGCFGASKKKKEQQAAAAAAQQQAAADKDHSSANGDPSRMAYKNTAHYKGAEQLWQPDVVHSYLALLQSCSNPETLEAAAGALQNLAACYWQPSIEIRATVRKEKGLPILVELLRMEVDRVVCAVATALRNLAIDQRNKELIGKYAMRDLVQKLPSGNPQCDQGTSDDTIAAVLATLNEVIKKNAEFARSLLDAGGVERLMNMSRQKSKYTPRVLKFASQLLFTMWQHQDLRDVYKKHGWKEQDFVTKTIASRNLNSSNGGAGGSYSDNSPNSPNNTLNRPMASQSGTRYEDRTMKRQQASSSANNGGQAMSLPPGDGTIKMGR
uniref:catenin delta-2 n=1 Tax=Anopheles coluzzii TaxID=1518534 RepID=UPI0020FF8721|nr:catenin delta-2 [Anopheles coluzzii]XP_040233581.2 catenin delta-2 [Anopheles coluzzii]XP_049466193.1 catenin delta-2 [Anopheles coluzzii]XP_049466194.1 catenin delta-2 [Anopheles coluzzii]